MYEHALQGLLKNKWYIGCKGIEVSNKKLSGGQICDIRMVFFRSRQGKVKVLKDREVKNGYSLLEGSTINSRRGTIQCSYNGWRYDGNGNCISVPGIEPNHQGLKNYRIASFPVCEQDGYVWVWLGDGKPSEQPPEVPFDMSQTIWNQQTQVIDSNPILCIQHEMDWASSFFQKDKMKWMNRRLIPGLYKPAQIVHPYHLTLKSDGFELYHPPIGQKKSVSALSDMIDSNGKLPRNGCTSEFSASSARVIHRKWLKYHFWRKFGDYTDIVHFVPLIDPVTRHISTRVEYMWTPWLLPGYSFQRNQITSLPSWIPWALPRTRKADKRHLQSIDPSQCIHPNPKQGSCELFPEYIKRLFQPPITPSCARELVLLMFLYLSQGNSTLEGLKEIVGQTSSYGELFAAHLGD
ncbi:uncharacterized protein LOC126318633 [Schistocerca gregaria]|uniref:uncharacterized protein LOC126318633 n=1 Tax=Schistocerca gregaria TaxID=7010 RepID=UPI00211EA2F7|nr:uncharacterized protein LOC126318633 [Schistocerca gregaria]